MADQPTKGRGAAAQAAGTQAAAQAQARIVWDDTNMRSVYANVANVAGTREGSLKLIETARTSRS